MLTFLLTSSLHGQNPWLTIFWCGKVWFTAVFVTKALFLILFLVSGCLCYLDHLDRRKIFKAFSCCSSEIALTCNIDKLQPCKNRDVVRRRPFRYFLSLVFSYSRECPSDVVIGLNSIVVYYCWCSWKSLTARNCELYLWQSLKTSFSVQVPWRRIPLPYPILEK